MGSAASLADARFRIDGEVPIELPEEIQTFETLQCRFDGGRLWFDRLDMQADPMLGEYLRSELAQKTPPTELDRPGMKPEHRAVYELNYFVRHLQKAAERRAIKRWSPRDDIAGRLGETLSHAGAKLLDYVERNDGCRVTFTVDGQRYTSSVNKDDLSLQVAGVCLSGEDAKFDLSSLVGVLREGDTQGDLLRIGGEEMSEEEYWDIHLAPESCVRRSSQRCVDRTTSMRTSSGTFIARPPRTNLRDHSVYSTTNLTLEFD